MNTKREILTLLIISVLIIVAPVISHSEHIENGTSKTTSVNNQKKFVIERTYRLLNVSPKRVKKKLSRYIIEFSVLKEPNIIRVKLERNDLKVFEKKLLKLENEDETLVGHKVNDFTDKVLSLPIKIFSKKKKSGRKVVFKIYTVLASKEEGKNMIIDQALREVVDELKKLLNFKSFKMDGVTTLTVSDGSQNVVIKLPSRFSELRLNLGLIKVNGKKRDSREIYIDKLILWDGKEPIISTRTSAQEGGHLVVGVTQVGVEQDSLILIMHAKIK